MRIRFTQFAAPSAVALVLLAATACTSTSAAPASASAAAAPALDAGSYYAVLLTNGSVYFGKVQGLGSPFPVLRDVYYIQTSVNPDTKAQTNVLVKRGRELHAPDSMMVNASSIVLVEPVGKESKVAGLIAEAAKQP